MEELEKKQEERESAEQISKKIKHSEKGVRTYQTLILRLLILMLAVWVLFFQIIGLTHMPSADMYPRLDADDLLLYYRLDKDVLAQDVIVIEKATPDSNGQKQLFVGRVVAVAGDTVDISDSERLIINGNAVIETNIFYPTPRYEGYTEFPLTLGEDECFVLVDSREGGTDSRYYGPVSRDEIVGTVISFMRRVNL